jgi:hypothetical protein
MRLVLATLAIAVFSVAVPGAAIAQERLVQLEALPTASRTALLAWLQRDCSVAATPEELMRLRALSAVAQEPLIEAYRQGPPPDLERTYEAAFSEAFAARNTALGREGAKLFGAEDAARLQSVERDTYVRRRLEAARLNYRTNAVLGLGAVGASAALPLLDQIAGEADNPMREAARSSIATLRDRQPPESQQPR